MHHPWWVRELLSEFFLCLNERCSFYLSQVLWWVTKHVHVLSAILLVDVTAVSFFCHIRTLLFFLRDPDQLGRTVTLPIVSNPDVLAGNDLPGGDLTDAVLNHLPESCYLKYTHLYSSPSDQLVHLPLTSSTNGSRQKVLFGFFLWSSSR